MNAVMVKPVVFVCGICGVGKSHSIHQVLPKLPEAVSWTASEIIGLARQNTDPESLRTLPANELARSQELLVLAFRHRCDETTAALIPLDGHCVLDTEEAFFAIDTGLIRRLDPIAFIHIEEHVERILDRRTADKRKRRPARSTEQLRDYQDRSRQACVGFQSLRRPMFQIHSGDAAGFLAALDTVGATALSGAHHMCDHLSSVRFGHTGESQFTHLCDRANLTCNKSDRDATGWDFLVEFPMAALREGVTLHQRGPGGVPRAIENHRRPSRSRVGQVVSRGTLGAA